MNLLKLTWKNLMHRPLNLLLSLLLLALGIGLISLLLLLNSQIQEKFDKNLAGIDLVVGAKGSPLQVVLNSVFHVDYPTGNISFDAAERLKKHPFIEKAIDLSMGDSYKGFRIIGTSHDYVNLYKGEIQSGKLWQHNYEVVLGGGLAKKLALKVGDTFYSSHGFAEEGFAHDEGAPFKVVGILQKNNSVLDQLILTNKESIWAVHGQHNHEEEHDHDTHEGHDHDAHEEHNHDAHEGHDHEEEEEETEAEEKQITSMLVFYKNKMATVTMPRLINENTDMQAASPAFEMNRLYSMMGTGQKTLEGIAIIIMVVSIISIFISLYNSMKDRKYEIALMRVMGASRGNVFLMVLMEGFLIALLGSLLGLFLSHLGLQVMAGWLEEAYRYEFEAWRFLIAEWLILAGALLLGLIAAIIPAILAYQTDISETLGEA